jgi:uncharacterized delta-60 repeat protein
MKIQKMLYAVALFLSPFVLVAQVENWVYRYNGPGNSEDCAESIVYGDDGNIYTAGYSYDTEGYDLLVISLTRSGTERWVYQYSEPGDTIAIAYSIIYGSDGNVYAAGRSVGSGTNNDIIVISLDTLGTENWVYRYNGPGNDFDIAYSIIYGLDGNLYIAGSGTGIGTDDDFTVISLTTSGTENWIYTYNGPGNLSDCAYSLIYGLDGNLYATGWSTGIGTEFDVTVISLTASGNERWIYRYNGTNARDRTLSIIYGDDGNIYTAGYVMCPVYDFAVISLTSTGTERWIYLYDGPISSTDRCNSIVYGPDGNLYGCGHSIDSPTGFDGVVISLTPSGSERWVYRYDRQGQPMGFEELWSLVYGPDSNIYVAGYSADNNLFGDFTIISLTPSGTENWVYWYNRPGAGNDSARDIVYGADGCIYAAGFSTGDGTDLDFTVISLNPGVYVSEKTNCVAGFSDLHCYPNPFSEKTVIEFELPSTSEISLKIFDIKGSLVRTLFDGTKSEGIYRTIWDGKDHRGSIVSEGCYIIKADDENRTCIKKIIKLRR